MLKGVDSEKRTVAENARVMGFVYQNVNHQLFEESVLKELLFAPLNMGMPMAGAVKVVHDVAASLDLTEEELALSPLLLSGGEKQRVAIASVLTPGPDIIALDEPTLGLNQGLKERLADVMRKLKEGGRTVVMVTHDVEFAMANTDRVALMANGEIIACGGTREILNSDVIERASLHPSQAVEIGKKLGVGGILTVDELVVREA
jgi:energy-coupling factor transporter ATP-binding protein EcfA2